MEKTPSYSEKSERGKWSRIQKVNVDMEPIMKDHRDPELSKELTTCQHFLVDSELVRSRQRVFKFASNHNDPTSLKDRLQHIPKILQCATKVNITLGFNLRDKEDGECRYFFAHENNLLPERSRFFANKKSCSGNRKMWTT